MTDAVPEEPDRLRGAPRPCETVRLWGQAYAEAGFLAALAAGRLHHGWLITGPRGVGKATLAWRIARHLVAGATGGSLDMDPTSPVFRTAAALAHPRILLCRRPWDEKTERLRTVITVEEVRALTTFFHLTAADGSWRVAIVDAADELNEPAANALLKILEEPPPRAALFLVCHAPARLLPTIRSRCRELGCHPLQPPELAMALRQAGADPDTAGASALASLAGGSVGTALRLVAGDGLALYGEILALVRNAPPADRRQAVALAEACTGRAAGPRYELTLDLIRLACSRLALAGAGAAVVPATAEEGALMARLGASPEQAGVWADAVVRMAARAGHARAVNLDPAQVILDMVFQIDAAAAEALARGGLIRPDRPSRAAMPPPDLVDSHCHLDFPDFAGELGAVVERAAAAGVTRMVTICTRLRQAPQVRAIAEAHPGVLWAAGTHPMHAAEEPLAAVADLVSLAAHPKFVGIGETGLDYHYTADTAARQQASLGVHIEAARATGLPLIVHARDADDDIGRILAAEHAAGPFACVMHCFTSGAALAETALALGFYLSVSGIATFRSAGALRDIFGAAPVDRILVETDSPYLAPQPHRGRRNEPAFTADTARAIAGLWGMDFPDFAAQTSANFDRLFARAAA